MENLSTNQDKKREIVERMIKKVERQIVKYASREDLEANRPFEISKFKDNCLLNEGINELFTIICSSGGTKWDNANARLGVGDSSTSESPTQTGLQATSNKTWKEMMSGYPTYGTDQKAIWRAQFTETEANYTWTEFTLVNAADDSGKNLNRKVSSQGTKLPGQIWELSLQITLT